MLVFWDERLAFLATPKTGSTAIAAALESLAAVSIQRPPLLKHTTVHRYRRFIGPYLEAASKDTFTLVALMREPRDWLGSWYRFRQRDDVFTRAFWDPKVRSAQTEAFFASYRIDATPRKGDGFQQKDFALVEI